MIDPQPAASAQALDQQPAVVAALHFEIGDRLDQVRQAREAIIARGVPPVNGGGSAPGALS